MIFGQLPHGGQFVFQVEVHSLSRPMTRRFRGSAPILPQSSFRYPTSADCGETSRFSKEHGVFATHSSQRIRLGNATLNEVRKQLYRALLCGSPIWFFSG
jgi:hypothetical protein